MSKRDRETNRTNETSPNLPPPPPSVSDESEIVIEEDTAIAAPADVAPKATDIVKVENPYGEMIASADPESMAYMIPALPHLKDTLLKTKRVGAGEYETAIQTLDDKERNAYLDLTAKINPEKEFVEDGRTGMVMSMLKMDQGAGDSDKRPPKSVKGAIFSTPAMELITVPEAFVEEKNLPSKVKIYVLGLYSGRQFWSPRDKDGKPQPLPGIDVKGNAPICSSYDRKVGSRFGECKGCAYRPFANGTVDRNACKDDIHLFICMADLSGVYQINVAATSFKTCTTKISQKTQGWRVPWQGAFWLSAQLVPGKVPGQEYAIWTATPVTSKDEPNGVRTPDKLYPLLGLFARQIKTEIHLPRLAAAYSGAAEGAASTGEPVAEASADMIAAAAGGMDYSQAGSGNV